LGVPLIPEAAELVRRLQAAATLAIHLRAAEPDWSECVDSVISSSYAAPMDATIEEQAETQLEELSLQQISPYDEPRVGDLLISHPVWSVLHATFDRSVILIVAVDGLTGIKGLCLNKSQGQTLEIFLAASGEDLPKLQCWMKGKDLSNGGPLTTYGSEVDSLHWIHGDVNSLSFCGDLEAMAPTERLRFFRGCAKWSWQQLAVDLERGFWIHGRPCAQSLHKLCFDNFLATRDVWHSAMMAAVGPVLADFPRGPAADPVLKQTLLTHYRSQATDIARQLFGPRSAEWERRLEAAKMCKAK